MFTRYISTTFLLLLLCSKPSFADRDSIVVSIKPLHSLVSHLAEGLQPVHLLLNSPQSPHHLQLRPSQKRLLSTASLFIYASDSVESFASGLNANSHTQFIRLEDTPELTRHELRGLHNHGHSHHSDYDGHIWLSVDNARTMASYLAEQLATRFPQHRDAYQTRLQQLLTSLDEIKRHNQQQLEPFRQAHFLVYHDAFQYFEKENRLTGAHFVTTSTEHSPGIRRVQQLQRLVSSKDIRCVFYEPPNRPALINILQETANDKLVSLPLDPLGWQIPAGKAHYFDLLRKTTQTIRNCLSK